MSVHIGSQITNHVPYLKMLKALQNVIDKSKFYFEYIDVGGGMGIDYNNNRQNLIIKNILIKLVNL